MSRLSSGSNRITQISLLAVVLLVALALGTVACGEGTTTDATSGGEVTPGGDATGESVTTLEGPMTSEPTEVSGGSLIGTWRSDQTGETMEFTADGRLIVSYDEGTVTEMTYTADGSNISYLLGGAVVYTGTYSVDGDVLSQVDPRIEGTVYFDRVE